jgi:Tfp pilus assembly protein PilF
LQGEPGLNETARALIAAGVARRRLHDTEGAYAAIAEAVSMGPDDPQAVLALAQISYETWRPAAELFARAQALDPRNMGIARGYALALNAEGQCAEAERVLVAALARHPEWIDGHKTLATIRTTAGSVESIDASFAEAVRARPDDAALHMAWFHLLAGARDWAGARTILAKAEASFGATRGVRSGQAFLASESDERSCDPVTFSGLEDVDDPGLDLARIRFWLRTGEPAKAAAIAEGRAGGPLARMFWPYLALAWRLTGDARGARIDGEQRAIMTVDLDLGSTTLAALEATLRRLLVLKAPYHEQSVRGGVQTDRHLFFNPDPVIQHARAVFEAAVRTYLATLPVPVAGHPLLGPPRDKELRFEGAWSVLLRGQGYHAPHTHMMGWISSAFYLVRPDADSTQGWLQFGTPPPELGLDLGPLATVEAKPGRLVLFPSTLWHGTLPFEDGERLSIAFDVAVPA